MRSTRGRALIATLALAVAWACLPFFPGLLGAGVLAVLGTPAHRRLSVRVGSRTAALLLSLLALVFVAAPALLNDSVRSRAQRCSALRRRH